VKPQLGHCLVGKEIIEVEKIDLLE
jgi:hypothetical protein